MNSKRILDYLELQNKKLTIKSAVPLSETRQQELTVVLNCRQEVSLTLTCQRLLHQTGAAGVVLRTEPQVLPYQSQSTYITQQPIIKQRYYTAANQNKSPYNKMLNNYYRTESLN